MQPCTEKRSCGSARCRAALGPQFNFARTAEVRRRMEEQTEFLPLAKALLKPLLAAASIYATLVVLVWDLWRRRLLPAAPTGASALLPQKPALPPLLDGRPFHLEGELLQASFVWGSPGSSGLVGDQRRHEAPSGFAPDLMRSAGVELAWGELFEALLADGRRIVASDCRLAQRGQLDRRKGELFELQCPHGLGVEWSAELLRTGSGAEVLRTRTVLTGGANVSRLVLWKLSLPCLSEGLLTLDAALKGESWPGCFVRAGSVAGSPLVDLDLGTWLALEHPRSGVEAGHGILEVFLQEPAMGSAYYASMGSAGWRAGKAPAPFSLLRRQFGAYLESLRPAPHRPHLHLSTWYDLRRKPCTDSTPLGRPNCSAAAVMDEESVTQRLAAASGELASRGLALDGLMLEDGWDDPEVLWKAHSENFPVGLNTVAALAGEHGVALGTWISPWGGFGAAGKRRVALGRSEGLEVRPENGGQPRLHVAGPRYWSRLRALLHDVASGTISALKLDGFGGDGSVDKLLELATGFRADVATAGTKHTWVTAATGSWPSPFWLKWVDAVWRGGPDLGRLGPGSPRQQWITFRDAAVYKRVVRRAPLFPLAALATGGIVYSRAEEAGAYLPSYGLQDFATDAWAFFMSGATHQELQVQPELLGAAHWDLLARAANVSRRYGHVLRDAHWFGGDPAAGEVYGYGAFACKPCLGFLSLRNPALAPQNLSFSLRRALDVPEVWPGGKAAGRWQVRLLPQEVLQRRDEGAVPGLQFWDHRAIGRWEDVGLDQELMLQLEGLDLLVFEISPRQP